LIRGVDAMPTISMFYGILVLMFFRDNRRHHLPHIHVRYEGEEAAIALELFVDWQLAVNGEEPFRIAPLQ
jgi:hypothetical protein